MAQKKVKVKRKLIDIRAARQGKAQALAKKWLWNKIMNIRTASITQPEPGRMYMFYYDAKWKDTLPHWDAFPLSIIVDYRKDGFTGLNLHYLSPTYRWALLDKLLTLADNPALTTSTKLNLSYGLLSSTRKYAAFRPCFKQYLYGHVMSKFVPINPMEYDLAIALPTARFHGAMPSEVWADSRSKI